MRFDFGFINLWVVVIFRVAFRRRGSDRLLLRRCGFCRAVVAPVASLTVDCLQTLYESTRR